MTVALNSLDLIENFPGWGNAKSFLQEQIRERGARRVADVGGGANPVLGEAFVRQNGLDYSVIDISATELGKTPEYCKKIEVDLATSSTEFLKRVGENKFDLIFSCMLMEHIETPLAAHRNIYSALVPGGVAIHLYPSPNNLPLALNRVLPEWLGRSLVKLSQPTRDLTGKQLKFRAYYRMCGNYSRSLHGQLERIGYKVVRHTSYVGHEYYARFPLLRDVERAFRRPLVRAGVPLTGAQLMVLQK